MEFNSPYLTEQIIAYIGNKRKLLSLIYKAIENAGISPAENIKFFDVFSGSGVVARFAKFLGMEVYANDWEYYSYVLNQGFLNFNESDIEKVFGSRAEFESLLNKINSLPVPGEENQYIAKYYAPKEFDVEQVDYKTERLFYTRENALAIDKIRNYIEENRSQESEKIFYLLLAILIYESATHTNTSGVFKAFHKEFGGHGKDALSRIMKKIELHFPVLIDSKAPVHVFQENANELARKIKGIDIAYLDPPYNQHPYGSNYFMLNLILKNKLDVEVSPVSGITQGWNRSVFNKAKLALDSMEQIIASLQSKYTIISYNSEGFITFDQMVQMLQKYGEVKTVEINYNTFRGSRNLQNRSIHVSEYLFVLKK